jgi:cell wall-associated NlpC family hydrolase
MKQDFLDLSQLNADAHWAIRYIGLPWVNGGQGPDSFDCWGFFRYVQKENYGISVPIIETDADDYRQVARTFADSQERAKWIRKQTPECGDAVLLAHARYPSHVGVYVDVDGGGVLHCVRGEGVVFSTMTALKLSGWGRIEIFRHASHA